MEILLKNGLLPDGSVADIRIVGEFITEIGQELSSSGELINCAGLRILPGFVDLHTHLR